MAYHRGVHHATGQVHFPEQEVANDKPDTPEATGSTWGYIVSWVYAIPKIVTVPASSIYRALFGYSATKAPVSDNELGTELARFRKRANEARSTHDQNLAEIMGRYPHHDLGQHEPLDAEVATENSRFQNEAEALKKEMTQSIALANTRRDTINQILSTLGLVDLDMQQAHAQRSNELQLNEGINELMDFNHEAERVQSQKIIELENEIHRLSNQAQVYQRQHAENIAEVHRLRGYQRLYNNKAEELIKAQNEARAQHNYYDATIKQKNRDLDLAKHQHQQLHGDTVRLQELANKEGRDRIQAEQNGNYYSQQWQKSSQEVEKLTRERDDAVTSARLAAERNQANVRRLERECQDNLRQLEEQKKTCKQWMTRSQVLQRQVSDLQTQLQESRDALREANATNALKIQKKDQAMTLMKRRYEDSEAHLKREVTQARMVASSNGERVQELEDMLEQASNTHSQNQFQMEQSLTVWRDKGNRQIPALEKQIEQLTKEISEAASRFNQEKHQLEIQLSEEELKTDSLQQRLKTMEKTIGQQKLDIQRLEQEKLKSEKETSELKDRLPGLHQKIDQQARQLDQLRHDNQQLKSNVTRGDDNARSLSQRLNEARNGADSREQQLKNQLTLEQQKVARLEAGQKDLQFKAQQDLSRIKDLEASEKALRQEQLQASENKRRLSANEKETQLSHEAETKRLTEENRQLNERLRESEAQHTNLQNQVSTILQGLGGQDTKLSNMQVMRLILQLITRKGSVLDTRLESQQAELRRELQNALEGKGQM
ncbi:hypothetical protein [Parendozoicomonas haliclonae]|uniref:Uncharacterized protein n=1 Tax=Parendozoicomonas haliclonae TaxID=1960125 RepID=A0A1X7AP46_9GAMM|nr:hypothetical protein [Parendozoicomonas haliclonae]SMA50091.1 hypothetical protein EHSB41UT_03882 [Parendozoicomonas haliclonae]